MQRVPAHIEAGLQDVLLRSQALEYISVIMNSMLHTAIQTMCVTNKTWFRCLWNGLANRQLYGV